MSKELFGSIITAMVTPFDKDGAIKLTEAADLAEFLVRDGWNDALVINGTTGEASTTSDDEKAELIAAVSGRVGGRAKIIAGVGSADTKHSIRMAQAAEASGADALLVVAPYYSRPSQLGVLTHFFAIADSTELPVMLYDIPKRSGIALEEATLIAAAEHPKIKAVKDAKGDLEAASWVMKETELAFYSGDDALNLPFLSIGAEGFVSVVGHVAADQLRNMLDAYRGGDVARAASIHRTLLPVYRGLFRAPGVSSTKAALGAMGLPASYVRLPLLDVTEQELALLTDDLAAAGIATA
ncbi:MAG: 4-hydroxy-tetrahydrodipicolinate synthase [Rhodoglobus sp.]